MVGRPSTDIGQCWIHHIRSDGPWLVMDVTAGSYQFDEDNSCKHQQKNSLFHSTKMWQIFENETALSFFFLHLGYIVCKEVYFLETTRIWGCPSIVSTSHLCCRTPNASVIYGSVLVAVLLLLTILSFMTSYFGHSYFDKSGNWNIIYFEMKWMGLCVH